MLIEQHHLINDDDPQRQQLRSLQAFHGHPHAPLKDSFEQPIKRFDGWRPQFMEDRAHLHAAIAVRIRPVATNPQLRRWHSCRSSGVL
ncbi:MAG TPA: hypothetical protein VLQ80_27035 [Candidatus Saccharimonadia bacterium]|nr:hypothetical protein [Candidatus Saccharimonadia bacterium]